MYIFMKAQYLTVKITLDSISDHTIFLGVMPHLLSFSYRSCPHFQVAYSALVTIITYSRLVNIVPGF